MNELQSRLSEGIAALKAGRKPEAEQSLKEVVQQDPQNAEAWLWLGAAVATPNETLYCLERVLEIDPENEKAQAGVKWAATQVAGDEKCAVNPIAEFHPVAEATELSHSLPASPTEGVDATIHDVHSLDGQDVEIEAPPSDVSVASGQERTSNFFPNLLIAALALILLLGILLIIALVRAWQGSVPMLGGM